MLAFRTRLVLGALYILLTILVLDGALWLFHGRVKSYFDEELGRRLTAIATTVSLSIDTDTVARALEGRATDEELDGLHGYLSDVAMESGLAGLYLLDLEERDLLWKGEAGERPAVINLDPVAVAMAEAGLPAFSETYRLEDLYFKSGYAPVTASDEVVAIVAAEADAAYFGIVSRIRQSLLAASLIGLGGAAVLGLLLVGLARSISRAEKAVGRADLLATLGRMAAAVAHDIRNPLGIIGGAAQRLKSITAARRKGAPGGPGGAASGADLDRLASEEAELLDFITEEVDRLDAIVKGYLEMSLPAAGVSRCDVGPLVERAAGMYRKQLAEAGVELEMDLSANKGGLIVEADAAQLQQAFLNVLSNAREAMPSGGVVSVKLYAKATDAVIEFRDSGEGMSRKDVSRVREPFFSRKQSGSGLGLAVVEKVMRDAGGKLEIESELGKGTTVRISLPTREE